MQDIVYDLWFVQTYEDRDDTELHIGIYRTEADAEAAISRLKSQPGFVDYPEGFEINPTRLNDDSWTEGFISESFARTKAPAVDVSRDVELSRGRCSCGRIVAKFSN